MNLRNKRLLVIYIVFSLILFICVIEPFLRETYLHWRLAKVDISPTLLIQEGDLPEGFIKGAITTQEPFYYQWVQAKEQQILTVDGTQIGNVNVYLFASVSEQSEMYSVYSQVESQEGIIPYKATGIGDQGDSSTPIFGTGDCKINVLFERCTAIVVFELFAPCVDKPYNFDLIVEHAKRLDEDLKPIACK